METVPDKIVRLVNLPCQETTQNSGVGFVFDPLGKLLAQEDRRGAFLHFLYAFWHGEKQGVFSCFSHVHHAGEFYIWLQQESRIPAVSVVLNLQAQQDDETLTDVLTSFVRCGELYALA